MFAPLICPSSQGTIGATGVAAKSTSLVLFAAALVGFATPSRAQVGGGLQEVVVTAERRAENVQDVPVAVSAFTGDDLAGMGVRQAGDITTLVPNLVLASPYGEEAQPVFSLRGVATNDFSQNQSSPIAMYVDEVYKPVGALQALQTFDLDRVEVLRGPQGTLYGKNATGGAVNFYSRNPSLQEYGGYFTAGVENYSGYSAEGAVGGPLIDNALGWRAAAYYHKRDGWLESVTPGVDALNSIDALAGRFTLLAKPSDSFSAQLKLSASRSRGTPYGVRPANVLPEVTGATPPADFFKNAALTAIEKTIDSDSASLKIDWRIAEHVLLTSVTGYDFGRWVEVGDDASVGTQIWGADTYASTVNHFSQEVRLTSENLQSWTWLIGAYYDHDTVHGWSEYHYFDAFELAPGAWGFEQANSYDQPRTSRAVFGNISYDVTPAFTLRGGLRYTKDSLDVKNFYALEGYLPSPPAYQGLGLPWLWTQTIPVIPGTGVDYTPGIYPRGALLPQQSQDNDNWSYKAGVDWKAAAGILAYVSISRGYRGAAFNSQSFNAPVEVNFAQPEELTAYELGLKSELLERRLQLNGALFYYDYKNQQFLDTYSANGVLLYRELNAPKSRILGGEVELLAKPTDDLEVRANIGVQDSKYLEFISHGEDVSGNQLAMSPNLTMSGGFDWRVASIQGGDLRVGADAFYYAKQFYDPANTERIAQGGYAVFNAHLEALLGAKHQYTITVWGKNLGNKEYINYALATQQPSQGGLGLDYTVPAEPRIYGLTATVHF
jgi:iron complex outermembrane receptor protein